VHLLFYTHNILGLGSFSTTVTIAILVGSAYGLIRLVRDVVEAVFHLYQRDQQLSRLISKIDHELDDELPPT
jgi:hypothetical protein